MDLSFFSWTQRTPENSTQTPSLDATRTFEFRLNSTHKDCDNTIATLHVEYLTNGAWQPFNLTVQTRGFQIFVYSCFICQHTYLRMNATELGLAIAFVDGSFKLTTTQDWQVSSVTANFEVYLAEGTVDGDETLYLIDRMKGCPVSRNLSHNLSHDVTKDTQLTIHPFQQPSDMPSSGMPQLRLTRSPQRHSQPQKHNPRTLTNIPLDMRGKS